MEKALAGERHARARLFSLLDEAEVETVRSLGPPHRRAAICRKSPHSILYPEYYRLPGISPNIIDHQDRPFGTGEVPDETIEKAVTEVFDFRPRAIIDSLGLRDPIFQATATYGHLGRTPNQVILDDGRMVTLFPWEALDKADDFRTAVHL